MSDPQSTAGAAGAKPAKPYPEFPLFAHATRRWAKKIRGRMHYFGPWDDPDGALKKYLAERDALHAGRTPRPAPEGLTVKALVNAFLNHKQALVDAGELRARTWTEYKETCDEVVARFGKGRLVEDLGPDDFAALRTHMAKRWGPVALGNFIQRVRCLFKFAVDDGTLERTPRFGQGFRRPSKKTLRLEKAKKGPRVFEAAEIRRMLDAAGQPLKAMILLGINAGLGNADCGGMPLCAVNLDAGWIDYPRPKTGIPRRCPLWPETVQALREALASRPEPKDPADAGLFFLTARGGRWHLDQPGTPIGDATRRLLARLGINGGRSFYTLRHTFRTVADEAKDQPAADYTMGHEIPHMSTVYRERISDDRLKAVSDHVRAWLFPAGRRPRTRPARMPASKPA
jgi:integrase